MTSEPQPLTEAEQKELAGLMAKAERGGLNHKTFKRASELSVRQEATKDSTAGAAR